MSTSTLALEQKRTLTNPNMGWSWQHATVKPSMGDQHVQTNQANSLDHDLSHVTTQTTPCPATPTRCPFGGACHTCPVRMQPRLKISQPQDEYEQEADRIADMVMRMPEPKKDEIEQCSRLGCGQALQRQATNIALPPGEVPPIVHEVLRSSGQPLDTVTRVFMETRFGHDFSQVRIHTDPKAAQSAEAIKALAYTVGKDVVFNFGQFGQGRANGQRTLAHELTHVIQQENSPILTLARQPVPVRPPMPVRVPIRPPLRVIPGGRSERNPLEVKRGERYAVDPYDDSWEAIMERASLARDREQAIWEGECPIATLERGGIAPDFITTHGYQEAIGEYGTIRYRRRKFHVLDAIEHDVRRARNQTEIQAIRNKYIPEWSLKITQKGGIELPLGLTTTILPLGHIVYPEDFDPDAKLRMQVYSQAVVERSTSLPVTARATRVSEETDRRRRRRSAYPICWATQLGPPSQIFFVRSRSERDETMALQARLQLRWREQQGDLDARRFHVHHVTPLFLGGVDNLQSNGTLIPALLHLRGHQVLRYQSQMLTPPMPLRPQPVDLYDHPVGTLYELVGFKDDPSETC